MKRCPYCNFQNFGDVTHCKNCDCLLPTEGVALTHTGPYGSALPDQSAAGASEIAPEQSITLDFGTGTPPLVLEPRAETLLGRADTEPDSAMGNPDVDLVPYGAFENGVSRVHVAINREGGRLTIIDMNSMNGTYVNDQRLIPHYPYVLRDGDQIRLGALPARVYFGG